MKRIDLRVNNIRENNILENFTLNLGICIYSRKKNKKERRREKEREAISFEYRDTKRAFLIVACTRGIKIRVDKYDQNNFKIFLCVYG